jgi:hypothetical protein
MEALSSSSRAVRLAAMVALAERPDRSGVEASLSSLAEHPSGVMRSRAQLALWILRFVERVQRNQDLGFDAVAQGQHLVANVYRMRTGWTNPYLVNPGWTVTIHTGSFATARMMFLLNPPKLIERDHELSFLCELMSEKFVPGSVRDLQLFLDSFPHRIDEILQDPHYQHLHDYYPFRVLTGLQEPIWIEEVPGFSPEGGEL